MVIFIVLAQLFSCREKEEGDSQQECKGTGQSWEKPRSRDKEAAAAQTLPQQTDPFSASHTSPYPLTFTDAKGMLAQGNETVISLNKH